MIGLAGGGGGAPQSQASGAFPLLGRASGTHISHEWSRPYKGRAHLSAVTAKAMTENLKKARITY